MIALNLTRAPNTAAPAAPAAGLITAPTSGMGRLLLIVGLSVGGFLIYRHFKKKAE